MHNIAAALLLAIAFLVGPLSDAATRSPVEWTDDSADADHHASHKAPLQVQPIVQLRPTQFDWPYEIRLALPPNYEQSKRQYPVLWVTDGLWMFDQVVSTLNRAGMTQWIIVAIAAPESALDDIRRRQVYQYSPLANDLFNDPSGLRRQILAESSRFGQQYRGGGVAGYFDFVTTELRSKIQAQYRTQIDNNILFTHSTAGAFAAYTLFTQPSTFSHYIMSSPVLNISNYALFNYEADYASKYADMETRVSLTATTSEALDTNIPVAAWGITSSTIRMAERLALRDYPSLQLSLNIFSDETHGTVAMRSLLESLQAHSIETQ